MPTITASYFLRLAVNLNQSMPNCDLVARQLIIIYGVRKIIIYTICDYFNKLSRILDDACEFEMHHFIKIKEYIKQFNKCRE